MMKPAAAVSTHTARTSLSTLRPQPLRLCCSDSRGAALVKPCYAELVRQLPNIHYALARETSLGEVILLRFQGGEGLLMTMKAECPSDVAGKHNLKPQRSSVEDEC